MSPTNLMVPFLCPATITLSPISISASDDMEEVRDLVRPENICEYVHIWVYFVF